MKERYGVAERAMRATLTALADAGLVDFRRGRGGSVVAATPPQDVYQLLVTQASRFPTHKLKGPREHRENATQVARAAATAKLKAALTSDRKALRAARGDTFVTAALLAKGIDAALVAGDPLASQTALQAIFATPHAEVKEARRILSLAGWVDVQHTQTVVTRPEARTRTLDQIRAGDVPQSTSPRPNSPATPTRKTTPRRQRGQ